MPVPQSDPAATIADHVEAYREHKAKALDLRLMIDNGLIQGMSPEKHYQLTERYLDELAEMNHRYTAAQILRVMMGQ